MKRLFTVALILAPLFSFGEEEYLEQVVVVGTRANLMNAIDKQMMADNIISVVDSDAIGNFPDATAADAVRRLLRRPPLQRRQQGRGSARPARAPGQGNDRRRHRLGRRRICLRARIETRFARVVRGRRVIRGLTLTDQPLSLARRSRQIGGLFFEVSGHVADMSVRQGDWRVTLRTDVDDSS